MAHAAHEVGSLLVEAEDAAVEGVDGQGHGVEGRERVAGRGEDAHGPQPEAEVDADEAAPQDDEGDERGEEEDGVGVQQARPAEPREHAPGRVRHVVEQDAQQEPAVAPSALGDDSATDEKAVVDDQVNHDRNYGERGI